MLERNLETDDNDDSETLGSDDGGLSTIGRDEETMRDILYFEENIGLSSSERHLCRYLPETIKKSEDLFDDTFSWWAE